MIQFDNVGTEGGLADDVDALTRDTLERATRMLGNTPIAREVVEYVYRFGVLDGQLKMSNRAEALVRSIGE